MNKSNIDWPFKPLFTWNAIVGCQTGCDYCYARRMNDRFKWISVWTNPVFFHDRLTEPYQRTIPSTIFAGSMCDMFGDWIASDWINEILYVARFNPQHKFMFLTKNPKRYLDFDFPKNSMLGCTITHDGETAIVSRDIMKRLKRKGAYTFVSIEPIHSGFDQITFDMFDLVIIGAESGRKPIIPQRAWVDSIVHSNIYYKNSIVKLFPDLKNEL
jgi:protein gp37